MAHHNKAEVNTSANPNYGENSPLIIQEDKTHKLLGEKYSRKTQFMGIVFHYIQGYMKYTNYYQIIKKEWHFIKTLLMDY